MSATVVWFLAVVVFSVEVLCVWHPYEPSASEYGIVQQAARRNNSHNLVLGWRQYGDRLLLRETVKKSYTFMGVVSDDLRYPQWGGLGKENITHIVALDQAAGNTGGYANLTSGGVGLRSLNIHFKSQRSRGFKFLVEIYGK